MSVRRYSSPGRAAHAQATRDRILAAARELLATSIGPGPSVGAIAARAGTSRLSVYHHFRSRRGVFDAITAQLALAMQPEGHPAESSEDAVRAHIAAACARWSADPALFRRLAPDMLELAGGRELAERLAADDALRPGCSIREAEDVLRIACSFAAFDSLYRDGRRSTAAVTEILLRMAAAVLKRPS